MSQPAVQSLNQPESPASSLTYTSAEDEYPIGVDLLQNPPGQDECCYDHEHAVYISLASRPVHYVQIQDGKTHSGLYRKGDILITPASSPLAVRWGEHEKCLHIRLKDRFLKKIARETLPQDCDHLILQPTFQARNPQIESIGTMLLDAADPGGMGSRLYLDSLANILAVHLLKQHATSAPTLQTYTGGLPNRQLQQVIDYIEASLDQDIKLADLAQLIEVSQFHFSRLFKQSLGVSPHQYLLQQRIERAKQLLKSTDRLIVDIAFECGFNSHSHLSQQFRRLTGRTPKAYRVDR